MSTPAEKISDGLSLTIQAKAMALFAVYQQDADAEDAEASDPEPLHDDHITQDMIDAYSQWRRDHATVESAVETAARRTAA